MTLFHQIFVRKVCQVCEGGYALVILAGHFLENN